MATFTDTIRILIQADGAKASSELERVGKTAQREMDRADKSTRNWSATFTRAGVGLTTFAAVAGAGLYSAAQAADAAQQAQLRLDNTIANSPRLTEQSARAFRDLASALMAKTVVDDDAIVSSQALLGQFGLTEQQILSLTPLVVDLSRKMGVDLDTASKAVAKAVNGSGTALNRMGIQVKAGADGVVGFTDVMDALGAKVGGFAEQEAKTFTGQIEQMKNQLGEVAEGIGGGVIPMFQTLVAPLQAVADGFASLSPQTQAFIGQIAGIAVAGSAAVGGLSLIAGQVLKMRDSIGTGIAKLREFATSLKTAQGAGRALQFGSVAAGVTLLGVVLERGRQRANEYVESLIVDSTPIEAQLEQVRAAIESVEQAKQSANGVQLGPVSIGSQDYKEAADNLDALKAKEKELQQQQESSVATTDRARAAQLKYAQALANGASDKELTAARKELIAATADDQRVQNELNSAMQEGQRQAGGLGTATQGAGREMKEFKSSIKDNEQAVADLVTQIVRYQDVLKNNRDSQRSAVTAQLDAADAVQDVADAQKTYNDAVAQYGPNSAEAAQAQRDLQRAVIGAYQAQDDATQALLDNAAAQAGYDRGADNNIKQTQRYVAELVKARNETNGPTRDAINQHIAKILGIPVEKATKMTLPEIKRRLRELEDHKGGIDRVPKEKKTKVTAEGTSAASAAVQRVRDQIAGLEDRNVTVTVTTVVNFANELGRRLAESLGFAKGGPIPAGLTAMVGEEGPELLVDRDDGRTRVVGADGPEMIRTTEPGFVIPNDKIRLGDGRAFAAGMLDNGQITATFVHNGPVDASTVATLYGDDQALLDRGRRSQGLLGRLAGRRAAGGPVEGGQAYLVGETGPELVVPQSDSTVMSNQRLRQLGYRMPQVPARGGDVIVVNFHGPVASQRQAEDWVVSALASARRRGNRLAS